MIALSIAGTEIQLKINDTELPPVNNFFKSFNIHAGYGYKSPTLSLVLEDRNKTLSGDLALVDGSKITLIYGFADKPKRTLNFTTISCKEAELSAGGTQFNIIASLGSPAYIFGAQQEAQRGSSVDAIRNIVESQGITYEGDVTTDDSMTWLNVGKSRSSWVHDIITRSYKDSDTVVSGLHDRDNSFRVRELFSLMEKDEDYTIYIGDMPEAGTATPTTFVALEAQPVKQSGITNLMFNYGHVSTQQRLDGKIDIYESVNPPIIEDGLPINQEVRNSFAYSSSKAAKYYDSGIGKDLSGSNAHEKYYEAQTQNARYLGLFNNGIRVNLPSMADMPLFSVVNVKAFNQYQTLELQENIQGKYFVGGVTVACIGSEYREFYSLYRCYVTQSGNTPLLGSKNQKADSQKPKMPQEPSVVDYKDALKQQAMAAQATLGAPQASAVQAIDSNQQNLKSGFDSFIDSATAQIDSLETSFASEGDRFGFSELSAKYSQGKDALMNLLSEFSVAKSILENCGELNPLESLSINLVKLGLDGIIDAIVDRIGRVEGLQASLLRQLNDLIAVGDINGGLLKAPQLNVSCRTFAQDHLNAALRDKFPDQCMDNFNLNRLRFPLNKLSRLKRLLMSFLRDLLCALGRE